MYAMELSGVHVGRTVRYTYRAKSWPKSRPDRTVTMPNVSEITHKREGGLTIKHAAIAAQRYEGKPTGRTTYDRETRTSKFDPDAYSYDQLVGTTTVPGDMIVEVLD